MLVFIAVLLVFPASALAVSTEVTRGVVGYGTVHVEAGSPPADCTSNASNPGGTEANVNAGAEHTCASITGSSYDTCETTVYEEGSFESCALTLKAQTAGSGWRFDHWSGDCSGTETTCVITTETTECDNELKPPCATEVLGPFTAVAHFVDTRAPTTGISQGPPNNSLVLSDTQAQQFGFSTDEENESPSFQCQKDGGSFLGCSSGITWSSIADGVHDFCVRATDPSGLVGGTVCRHWDQETNPTASVLSHPAATTGTPDASFTYNSNKAGRSDGATVSYLCWIDTEAAAACPASGKSYGLLANGQHTFHVEAVFHAPLDGVGVTHTSAAATYTWTQADTTGPTITVDASPNGTVTTTAAAEISWTGSEPTEQQTFLCKLDDDPAGFQPCTSPVTLQGLANGVHDFRIQGKDFLGNLGPVAVVHWDQQLPSPVAPGGGSGGGSGGSPCAKPCLATAARLVPVKAGKARVKLTCAAAGPCQGTLRLLGARKLLLGKAGFNVGAGETATVAVRLKPKAKALLLSAGHRLKATLAGTGVKARSVLLKEKT
ncbi:MAG: hypothetical protein ACM3Q9_00230 [Methanosarcina sp.]